MSKAINAALLSGLVMPGAGQLYLGKKLRGVILLSVVTTAIAALVIEAGQQAQTVLEQIQQQGGPVSTERIIEIASQSPLQPNSLLINIAMAALLSCWIFSVIDAYRTGKQQSIQ